MATSTSKSICLFCHKIKDIQICQGCSNYFCIEHLLQHQKNIQQQFDQLRNDHGHLKQIINDLKKDPMKHSFIKQIDQWETDSINKIKQHAQQCRTKFIKYSNYLLEEKEKKLNYLAQQIKDIHQENEFHLNDLKQRLQKLEKELQQTTNLSIEQQSTSFIDKFSLRLTADLRWKQFSTTIAGGHGQGNQLNSPHGISVDDQNPLIYIVDSENHCVVEWNFKTHHGRIVVGGNGQGNRLDQLNQPTDVIIDRQNNDLIIADLGNKRVMRCPRQSGSPAQIIINGINCFGLAMHDDGTLYVSDCEKDEVRRWRKGKRDRIIVAGGNGEGNQLNQLCYPTFLFVADDHTLYISDSYNHRVMKWSKDAREGIVVAGGNGRGDRLNQLNNPQGITVDQFGQIYVADYDNDRVMRWCEGETEGRIVVGGNGQGKGKNQLNGPVGLSFDREGHFYVADCSNHRIEKFERNFD